MDEAISEFALYMRAERGLSPLTVNAYLADVGRFHQFIVTSGLLDFKEVTDDIMISFLAMRSNEGSQSSSLSRYLIAVKLLFRFLKREGMIEKNPLKNIETPKLWQLIPEILNEQEIERLLSAPNSETPLGARDKALLEVLYATGIRATELCLLTIYSIDDSTAKVFGKGGKERLVPIGKKAIEAIDYYLMHFREGDNEALFLSRRGGKLDRVQVWRIIKKYAKLAGITKEISPHTLRHSFATHLMDNGADVRIIQEMLGHASISSTDRYTHISKSHLSKMFQAYHPEYYQDEGKLPT
ncbi:site-specific tyrosine recombinase XerD [Chlamydiales bacterium]|nr:site-specific tyrosine recombinase XerD [Chlamydiales bacterium]